MDVNELEFNDRVEYATRIELEIDGKKTRCRTRQHAFGYVKAVHRGLLRTTVEIVESRTRRVDTVRPRDIFAKADRPDKTEWQAKHTPPHRP